MDLAGFDRRAQADEGVWIVLKDDITGEELGEDGDRPRVKVGAPIGRKVNDKRKEISADILDFDAVKKAVMSQDMALLQQHYAAQAYPVVIELENVSVRGEKLTASYNDIKRLCDLTVPKYKDGELANHPFALQITNAAVEFGENLGKK